MGLMRIPCNFEQYSITTATDTGYKRLTAAERPAPVRTPKQVRLKFTGFLPGALPAPEQRHPSTSTPPLAPSMLRNSQRLNRTASSSAWFNGNLLHFWLFCLFYTHSGELELQILATTSCETTTGPQNSSGVSQNDATLSNFHIRIPLLHLFLGTSHQYF